MVKIGGKTDTLGNGRRRPGKSNWIHSSLQLLIARKNWITCGIQELKWGWKVSVGWKAVFDPQIKAQFGWIINNMLKVLRKHALSISRY